MYRCFFFMLMLTVCSLTKSHAQTIENAGDYMTQVSGAQMEMNEKYMAYVSAAAHSRRARKVEKLRAQALESINNAKYKTIGLPKYKGDNSLRQASIDYIQFCYRIFNEDYSKIVNMEEIAEQSVDQMQAYLLLEEKTSQKLEEASANLAVAEKEFAAKNSVILVDTKNDLNDKMASAGQVTQYADRIYILFFKCNWEDGQLFNALNSHKINDAEQARNALISFADEGLAALKADSLKDYKGHSGLANGCREALEFYSRMAKNDIPKLTDFYLKQENFDKIKKSMNAKGSRRTKADVEEYNKAVKEMNASVSSFNELNQDLNKRRQEVSQHWEESERIFKDDLMPYYK
ncbi:MAG: hypothetical protein Q8918_09600 [Bacteroidota bacterium]|nr:hypothetical protein [Bacteroidota bacterium]